MQIDLSNMVLDNGASANVGAGLEFIKRKKLDWLRAKLLNGPALDYPLDALTKEGDFSSLIKI